MNEQDEVVPKSIFHRSLDCDLDKIGEIIVAFKEFCFTHLGYDENAKARVIDLKIALTELLNNVALHGGASHSNYYIVLEAEFNDGSLKILLCDNGVELPAHLLDENSAASPLIDYDDLPEKGFGWFLIHQIFDVHSYQREGGLVKGHNRLILHEKDKVAADTEVFEDRVESISLPHRILNGALLSLFVILSIPFLMVDVKAEPSNVQFCKVMGAGYFKIDGMENCLKISGYARVDVDVHPELETQEIKSVASINLEIKRDTELGMLYSKIGFLGQRISKSGTKSSSSFELAKFNITLPNWFLGYEASTWVRNDWGGYNIKSGPFAYHESFYIRWRQKTKLTDFQLSIEIPEESELELPALLAYGAFKGRWGKAYAGLALSKASVDKSLVSVAKLGIEFNLTQLKKGMKFKLQSSFGRDVTNTYLEGDEFDFIAAVKVPVNKTLTFNATYGTSDNFDQDFTLAANLVWKPVKGFKLLGEVDFSKEQGVGAFMRIERRF